MWLFMLVRKEVKKLLEEAMDDGRGGDGAWQETLREQHVLILENSGARTGAP
jgi:hypothetical protein